MGLSIREYAKHIGRHHSTVQEAIASGKIKPLADGTIDMEQADREWRDNINPARAVNAPSGIKAIQEIKLKNEAALLHYKVQKESGKYIPKEEVRNFTSAIFADLREQLIGRCHRLAPRLVNQSDISKIARILEEDTKQIITEYRNDFQSRILASDSANIVENGDTE